MSLNLQVLIGSNSAYTKAWTKKAARIYCSMIVKA